MASMKNSKSMKSKVSGNKNPDQEIEDKDVWAVIGGFFDEYGLLQCQLDGYNEFIENGISDIIDANKRLEISNGGKIYVIEFSSPVIDMPVHKECSDEIVTIYPKQCVDRDITYLSHLFVDITFTNPFGTVNVYKHHHIGSIPVMVMSRLCNLHKISNDPQAMADLREDVFDRGGYFIINGSEKIVTNQQRTAYNKIYVFLNSKRGQKYPFYTDVRSSAINGSHSTTTQVGLHKTNLIGVTIPYIDSDIPLGIMFRALGAKDSNEILRYILPNLEDKEALDLLNPSLEHSWTCRSQESALDYIGRRGKKFMGGSSSVKQEIKKVGIEDVGVASDTDCELLTKQIRLDSISYAKHLISTEVLPHLGTDEKSFGVKMFYLGYMTFKLIEVYLKRREPESRDHYANKRVATTGAMLSTLFYNAFKKLRSEICNSIIRCINGNNTVNILTIINFKTIKTTMCNAISNNNWVGRGKLQGVSQTYEKFNYMMTTANPRKLTTPINADGNKIEKPRQLDDSHWGIVCVTGDTEILLSDGNVCRMDELNGRSVMTVDPVTLKNEPSGIFNSIKLTPEKLIKIVDDCGRELKCTPDHPFLVKKYSESKNLEWVKAGDLVIGDLVVVLSETAYSSNKKYIGEGKCLSQINFIENIDIEEVYDFTTISPNHSFCSNGFITHNCPSETPEGKSCGLVTNQAMTCIITTGSSPIPILELLENIDIIKFSDIVHNKNENILKFVKVFVNGYPYGVTKDPHGVTNELRALRRVSGIDPETSISYDSDIKEINIFTDSGRLCRPLLIVEKGKIVLKKHHIANIRSGKWNEEPGSVWTKLLGGFVELIDKSEEDYTLIQNVPSDFKNLEIRRKNQITHCELHPSLIYATGASIIPFPDHNQCIFEDEIVYMADSTSKKIKDVKIGDVVITFDPENGSCSQSYSTITHTYHASTKKKMYEVETVSGRKIKATFDHRFMTSNGWELLEDIPIFVSKSWESFPENGSLIGISLELTPIVDCKRGIPPKEILSIENFTSSCMKNEVSNDRAVKYAFDLNQLNLLPLKEEAETKLYVLSRIIGYSLTSSWKYLLEKDSIRCSIDFDDKESRRLFIQDAEYLGFNNFILLENDCEKPIYKCEKVGAFPALIKALSFTETNSLFVPEWIINSSSTNIKREFLSGIQGGEKTKIIWNKFGKKAEVDKIIWVNDDNKPELFVNLFEQLNIESEIYFSDNIDTESCGYKINSSPQNLIKYFDTVSCRYNVTSLSESGIVIEYIRYLEKMKALKMKAEFSYEDWVGIVKVSSSKTTIFIPLETKTEIKNVMIADITTKSKNQSFLCGDGFCVHNSPRNCYQGAMGKQAIGIPGTNYNFKAKGKFHVLKYPQKPIVSTNMSKIMGFDDMPAGQNAIVAVCPWYGFNQEDSLIMNQDSIDRGFMVIITYMSFDAKIKKDKGQFFEVPLDSECGNFKTSASCPDPAGKLDPETGIIKEGTIVEEGDILIGRVELVSNKSSLQRKLKNNLSISYDHKWPGVVHLVQRGIDGGGYDYVRVVVTQERPPQFGDKFCYSPDHDVLTTKGWVNIADVSLEDEVATLSEKGTIEYNHPTEIFEYDHDGEMVEVDTNQVSLCVTPNHKMYIRKRFGDYQLVEAQELHNIHVHYKKNGIWEPKNGGLKHFTLPSLWYQNSKNTATLYGEKYLDIDSWLIFFGIWIAEGCERKHEVNIDIHKERVKAVLFPALDKMGFSYKISKHGDRVFIAYRQLTMYMTPLSVGAINKSLPDWVWELNESQSRLLLDSMCLGDGHMNANTVMYDTSSIQLKDDTMKLVFHCGWAANAYIRYPKGRHQIIKGSDCVTNADAWRITVVKTQLEPAVNKHIKNQQKFIPYVGKVHCFTVPNHIIYVRRTIQSDKREQKPVWSSNSARHGQKGTVGIKYRSYELPRTREGIAPDIVMNPLALPSRMTIGMMIEMICGRRVCTSSVLHRITTDKVFRLDSKELDATYEDSNCSDATRCISSEKVTRGPNSDNYDYKTGGDKYVGDGTPFQKDFSVSDICKELKSLGINEFCDEEMINGMTGEPMKCLIFTGIAYYQRLKHMVIDKVHSRSRGGRVCLTRQPKEGRKLGGGFRVGHMERDCLLAQGSSWFTKDRLIDQSDETKVWFCKICGLPALTIIIKGENGARDQIKSECRICQDNKVAMIKIPYATKLFMQELAGMNIIVRVMVTPYGNPEENVSIFAGDKKFATGPLG
jgi:DNA-directed RNA polymerase beta subunit